MNKLIWTSLLMTQFAMAGTCVITTTRTACPGQETESYAKCPGDVQTCSTSVEEQDAGTCTAAAVTACANARYKITKYKTITATFDGQDFAGGEDFCAKDSGSYSVSQNFPYKDKADCQ